jgi:DNA-binding XRE family transcriptional regulator
VIKTKLRKVREACGQEAQQVAKQVGCDKGHYSNIENAKATASPDLANRIARHFGLDKISREQILYPEEYMVPLDKPIRASRTRQLQDAVAS